MALKILGPFNQHRRFTINLKSMAKDHQEVEAAIVCLESFVRDALFAKNTWIAMVNDCAASAGPRWLDASCNPWSFLQDGTASDILTSLELYQRAVKVRSWERQRLVWTLVLGQKSQFIRVAPVYHQYQSTDICFREFGRSPRCLWGNAWSRSGRKLYGFFEFGWWKDAQVNITTSAKAELLNWWL